MLKEQIMDTMFKLALIPGISGTKSENFAAVGIHDILKKMAYFLKNPELLKVYPVQDDPLERTVVTAMVKGKKESNKTVIITGHYDVVGIDDFGPLMEIAFDPIKITKRIHELPLDEDATKDLHSGDWIFGRGTADMKFGIALGIEILRYYSERRDFSGNILFIAVPGEESNSEGMLAAVHILERLQNENKLEFKGAFVSECCLPDYVEDDTKKIYLGTCGKIMPLLFFAGKAAHVCDSTSALNPNLLASEVNAMLELNTDFCESSGDIVTAPPTCLKQTDLKEYYSVQTPLYAAAYYNLLTIGRSTSELISLLKDIGVKAFDKINEKCKGFGITYEPRVMTYEELYEEVKRNFTGDFDNHMNDFIDKCTAAGMGLQTTAIHSVKETFNYYSVKEPTIVISFAPPFYPSKSLDKSRANDEFLLHTVQKMLDFAKVNFKVDIAKRNYFMGICDLSYTGNISKADVENCSKNIIGMYKNYTIPFEKLKLLSIPGVVFGGFGKDFHKCSERLNLSYSFEIVPELYKFMIEHLLL
ncbi:M20/M25/M40 family metallo-hydrolase [Sporomusa acidovorans]|uniref:Protein RocB n=1 Tax=Sporomusa acidovorans (strain ATCC 49682 / DSM 3132 / Mol) TaxID=1123286 RepID=A0ABZ3J5H0_SPOA4|nr:M20/M25/M40 family metallo-hydrolase [Sporomusa acidovorans]OZC15541.1 succinyl-diaminopimelate desuccinylase [Sporomusa acidovorans DSM 3132]SDE17485.1 Arginine utilization protein RocB [Sporomusa acidovorans]